MERFELSVRCRFVMRKTIDKPGFKAPASRTLGGERQTVALAELIAIVGLAFSTVVAATVVSVGIARADVVGNVIDNEGSLFTISLVLGLIFMAGLTVFTLPRHKPKRH
jgi:hypothetical protein